MGLTENLKWHMWLSLDFCWIALLKLSGDTNLIFMRYRCVNYNLTGGVQATGVDMTMKYAEWEKD